LARWSHRTSHVEATFDPFQPGVQTALSGVGGGQQDAGAHQLQLQARGGCAAHRHQAGRQHLGGPGERTDSDQTGLGRVTFRLVTGHIEQTGRQSVRHGRNNDQVT
jgi:hypothetical protein